MSDIEQRKHANPFVSDNKTRDINQGVVAVESERAIAEVKAKLLIAQQCPRDEHAAYNKVMKACMRPMVAEQAEYAYPKGGATVTGPSIRLAEEMARGWGNIEYGIRELSQKDGFSEMEAYAWDLETNVRSTQHFTVVHKNFTKKGVKTLEDDRDIYEKTANYGARRLRSRILAVLPPELIEDALKECRSTRTRHDEEPLSDRIKTFVNKFGKLNVSKELIEKRLGHPVEEMTPDDLAEYRSIFNSLRDNMSKVGDWFDVGKEPSQRAKELNDKLNGKPEQNTPPSAGR